jgi:DNA-directed RNA polymerase specialized sigma subunit
MSRSTKGQLPRVDERLRLFIQYVYFKRLATQVELAKFLGLSQSTISRVVSE